MSDTTTISAEERARLRGILSEHGNGQVEDRIILRLLNTLEDWKEQIPEECPITGLPYFNSFKTSAGVYQPFYGGPCDVYGIPYKDEDGYLCRKRLCLDSMREEDENMCLEVVEEERMIDLGDAEAERDRLLDYMEIERKELEDAIVAMANRFDKKLFALSESELANQWHFKWDDSRSVTSNLYNFFSMLELHNNRCRRWEEHHNGSCCVVERVRDKHLIPRIKDFESNLRRAVADSEVK